MGDFRIKIYLHSSDAKDKSNPIKFNETLSYKKKVNFDEFH